MQLNDCKQIINMKNYNKLQSFFNIIDNFRAEVCIKVWASKYWNLWRNKAQFFFGKVPNTSSNNFFSMSLTISEQMCKFWIL